MAKKTTKKTIATPTPRAPMTVAEVRVQSFKRIGRELERTIEARESMFKAITEKATDLGKLLYEMKWRFEDAAKADALAIEATLLAEYVFEGLKLEDVETEMFWCTVVHRLEARYEELVNEMARTSTQHSTSAMSNLDEAMRRDAKCAMVDRMGFGFGLNVYTLSRCARAALDGAEKYV